MIDDEIVREVRGAREAFAASHGFDIRRMMTALRAMDDADDRLVVGFLPRFVNPEVEPVIAPTGSADTEPGRTVPRI